MFRLKNILVFFMLFSLIALPVSAFNYELEILTKDQIKQLTNADLLELYKNVAIERRAEETFFGRAGFSAKDYQMYKDLLEFIVNIREEMETREIEPLPISDWLK